VRILLVFLSAGWLMLLLAWPISHLPSKPLGDHYPRGVPVKLYAEDGNLILALRVMDTTGRWPEGIWTLYFEPLWTLVLYLAFAPVGLGMDKVLDARRRFSLGYCRACGYNLTGNVSGVCPECGSTVPQGAVSDQQSAVNHPAPGRSANVADPLSGEHAVE
jgi:hypothetical protein